ncbi:sel1 repeat family protein [Pseudoduganella flava]|uniref:Sel1 repeat family protein n=1 Tax=Pseudoduganella flava TaxID=871742 RepID=A0ABX6G0H5_9BURK|nr:sel1 repeat family protein [Pseudoduganella flava]
MFAIVFLSMYLLIEHVRYRAMHELPKGLRRFDLIDPPPVCARWKEHMPRYRDSDVFHLYIAARKLWRSKIEWQLTSKETHRILADVSTAAEKGDWGAKALLAHFYREGLGPLPENQAQLPDGDKAVAIARAAVAAGQPWGFYDLGVAHEHGYGGAVYDQEIAWAYYLRAAQLGSPEAQMALAAAYGQVRRFDDEERMLQCAAAQAHGPAAYRLAIRQEVLGNHREAAKLYQEGVKFGSDDSATSLEMLFKNGYWIVQSERENLKTVGLTSDPERAQRYGVISEALRLNPDLRLPNLDKVLPLPPTDLPHWDGIDDALEPEGPAPPAY